MKEKALNIPKTAPERFEQTWQAFIESEQLNEQQQKQFKRYLELLIEWNEKFNLTTITAPSSIVKYHFQDSLALGHALDLSAVKGIADVGAGAGFPGIPLKIKYPRLSVILIEVNHKKIRFLEMLIDELGLFDAMVYWHDWRTFLRKTEFAVDVIVARASLQPEELIRMFKPASPYKNAQLVYWASRKWEPGKKEEEFVQSEWEYAVGAKKRKLVFFEGAMIDYL